MELEVGIYCRYIGLLDGVEKIGKIIEIIMPDEIIKEKMYKFDRFNIITEKFIIKSSHTLLGNDAEPRLIEVGDYVNGLIVTRICEDAETNKKYINLYGIISEWEEEDIKSIMTKEQFSQISYNLPKDK